MSGVSRFPCIRVSVRVFLGTPCISWTPNCHLGMKQPQVMIPARMKALPPSQMTSVMSLSILLRKRRRKRRMKTLGEWRKGTMPLILKVSSPPGWKMRCRFQNVNLRRWKSERGVVPSPPLPNPSHVECAFGQRTGRWGDFAIVNYWLGLSDPQRKARLHRQRYDRHVMLLINTGAEGENS